MKRNRAVQDSNHVVPTVGLCFEYKHVLSDYGEGDIFVFDYILITSVFYANEYYKLALAINMPPKKTEEKLIEIIEEALRPIKDAM